MYRDTALVDAALHYHKSGWREGAQTANPDVRQAEIDPFLHYLRFGEAERRALRPKENPMPPVSTIARRFPPY